MIITVEYVWTLFIGPWGKWDRAVYAHVGDGVAVEVVYLLTFFGFSVV
jgi:hypothetical protein